MDEEEDGPALTDTGSIELGQVVVPEPDNLSIWYIGQDGVKAAEKRRVYALNVAMAADVEPEELLKLAFDIDGFLKSGSIAIRHYSAPVVVGAYPHQRSTC